MIRRCCSFSHVGESFKTVYVCRYLGSNFTGNVGRELMERRLTVSMDHQRTVGKVSEEHELTTCMSLSTIRCVLWDGNVTFLSGFRIKFYKVLYNLAIVSRILLMF